MHWPTIERTGSLSLAGAATSIIFVGTKVLSRQTRVCVSRDKTRLMSLQNYIYIFFGRHNRRVLSRQTRVCVCVGVGGGGGWGGGVRNKYTL